MLAGGEYKRISYMKIAKSILLSSVLSIMIGCGGSSNTQTTDLESQNFQEGNKLTTQSVTEGLKYDKDGKITTIDADAEVHSVAVSKEALFFAEGENGVEILTIGYNDKVSTELLYTIKDINARNVTLSVDGKILYVEDEIGFIQIIDISDLTHPKKIGRTTKHEIDNAVISKDGVYKYIPRGENGLEIINISNPSNEITESTFKNSNAFDVVLVENDTKALIATGSSGINLLDVSNPSQLGNPSNYRIRGASVTGLSLNATEDILFVATGKKGVLVFNVDILLHKLGQ